MSRLLDELIQLRRQERINYQEYLSKVTALSKQVSDPSTKPDYPPRIDTAAPQAFFDNLGDDIPVDLRAEIAISIDESINSQGTQS